MSVWDDIIGQKSVCDMLTAIATCDPSKLAQS